MLKITHIQRFSVHDGPGIRTTVFCKGCSVRCFWCHNPEAIASGSDLWYDEKQCIGCGSCKRNCPKGIYPGESGEKRMSKLCPYLTREDGGDCGAATQGGFPCAGACPSGALSPTGEWMEQDMLLKQLLRDRSHYRHTKGGVTFSGGEPLLQAQALRQIMSHYDLEGISRAVDTAGNVPWKNFSEVIPCTDLFLYDVKCMDAGLHQKGTGADNGLIQENLERLCHTGKSVWIRIPVIPGWNDKGREMEAIARRLRQLSDLPQCGIERIQLLPFHRFGREKYLRLGWEYPAGSLTPPSGEKMKEFLSLFQEMGLTVAEIGNQMVFSDGKEEEEGIS